MENNPLDSLPSNEWDAIIGSILKKFTGFCKSDALIAYDDLKQEAWISLLEAAQTYDPARAKFSTYAYQSIYFHLCRYVSKKIKNKPTQVGTDPFTLLADQFYHDDSAERSDILEAMFGLVKEEKHAALLHEHYIEHKSLRDIAARLDVSHETVRNRVNNLLGMLNKRLSYENA